MASEGYRLGRPMCVDIRGETSDRPAIDRSIPIKNGAMHPIAVLVLVPNRPADAWQ